MPKVFLSYSRADADVTVHLAQALKAVGLDVLLDRDLLPGGDWAAELKNQLLTADAVLAIISPHYLKSDAARAELSLALATRIEKKTTLIPVIVTPVLLSSIPPFLQATTYLDMASGMPIAEAAARIKEAVVRRPQSQDTVRRRREVVRESLPNLLALVATAGAALAGQTAIGRIDIAYAVVASLGAATGLSAIASAVSRWRRKSRSSAVEVLIRNVQGAYVSALQGSALNPAFSRESHRD